MKHRTRACALSALLLAVMGTLALTGCREEDPQALMRSAKEYIGKRDIKAAVIQLKSALQKEPRLAEARFLLGQALLDGGDPVSAEVELKKALEYKYDEATVVPPLARALVAGGKAQQVIQAYGATEFPAPEPTADLKTSLATAYLQRSANAQAQTAVDDALRAVKDFAPALLLQARMKAAAGDFDAAFALVDKILNKDTRNYEALQFKGDLLFAKGKVPAALQALREAVAVRPTAAAARMSMIGIHMSEHDFAAAKSELDAVKKAAPNHPQTRYFEAQLALHNKDFKTARELSQRLLKDAPDQPRVLLLAGVLELQSGSVAQAEALVARALQLAPDADPTRRTLAQIYLKAGQASKAQETLAPLLEKPVVSAETLGLLAQAELQAGNLAKAEGYFSRATKLDPNDARSRTALALGQFSKGNAELAFSQLQEIAAADKGTVADLALINAKMRRREFDGALKAIDVLERKQADKPLAALLRGRVQLAKKEVEAARSSFMKAQSIDPLYFPAAASLAALAVQERKFDEARRAFDKLLAADPKNVQALLAIAEIRAREGASPADVARLLTDAAKVNPAAPTPRLILVDFYLRRKDWNSALAAAQDGAAALPDNPQMLDALGRAQMGAGDTNQAITSFNRVAALQRRSPEAQVRLGEAYLAMKNYPAGRESLGRALEITPKFLPAQRSLIMLELAAGQPDKALAIARTVQGERPEQSIGYLLAGDVESIRKNWGAAASAYRASLKREDSADVTAKLHNALLKSSKPSEANAVADTWIKRHPDDPVLPSYLGDLALKRPDWAAAEGHYSTVARLQPDNATALNNLAWVKHKLGRGDALEYAEKANSVAPNQPAYLDTLARILSDSGQVDKAIELERRAVSLSPEYHVARLNLAKLYLKQGKRNLAKDELEKLSKLETKYPEQLEASELLKAM